MKRFFYLSAGHFCLGLALIGVFLPLLPTVPFVLLAAFCYSKGSERFHRWLIQHPRFGPPVNEWREQRIIRPRAKIVSICTILLSLSVPLFFVPVDWALRVLVAVVGTGVIAFLLSCPSSLEAEGEECCCLGES